jgi:phage shock protein C
LRDENMAANDTKKSIGKAGKAASKVRKIYRSTKDKKLAGVLGGVAEYAEIDPTIVRVLFLLFSLLTAVVGGVFVYLIAWIIMPKEGE